MEVEEFLNKAEEFLNQLPFSPNKEFYLVYVTNLEEATEIERKLTSIKYGYSRINRVSYFESVLGRIYLATDYLGCNKKPYFAIRICDEN